MKETWIQWCTFCTEVPPGSWPAMTGILELLNAPFVLILINF